jgi:hypothetical protein
MGNRVSAARLPATGAEDHEGVALAEGLETILREGPEGVILNAFQNSSMSTTTRWPSRSSSTRWNR